MFISDYLEMSGYSAITAEDGQAALDLVEKYHPHLLVTDIMMPRMDGHALVQQVRQRPEFRWLPVIFLTERASTEERIIGYQLGCDLYLPKPFEMQELGAMIRNLLARSYERQVRWQEPSDHNRKLEPTKVPTIAEPTLKLTPREQQVLNWLTQGLSNVEIGQNIHLSPRTVEKHVSSLLRKTETSNRAELLRFALENNLVE